MLRNKKVYTIRKISFNDNGYFLQGVGFKYTYDLYLKPVKSSDLNIFFVKNINENSAASFALKEIICKCICFPHKKGLAIFPILHTM